jgi:hypothetical protein
MCRSVVYISGYLTPWQRLANTVLPAMMRFAAYALLPVFISSLFTTVLASAQDAAKPATSTGSLPEITFSLDFPQSDPEHYSIEVSSDGHSSYDSKAKISPESADTDTFHLDFTMSQPTRKKIFDLAARANYFQSSVDSKRHVASTGTKTLTYKDAQHSKQVTYNYSNLPPVQELTTVFQNISQALEFGRRLQYDYRYQKLALDEELKRMDQMARANNLEEMQAVAPILNQIAADPAVINVVRARAQRLAAMADRESATR